MREATNNTPQAQNVDVGGLNFKIKDVVMIITLFVSLMGNYMALSSQIRELTTKFEDYKSHQDAMGLAGRALIDQRFNNIEIRMQKVEYMQLNPAPVQAPQTRK